MDFFKRVLEKAKSFFPSAPSAKGARAAPAEELDLSEFGQAGLPLEEPLLAESDGAGLPLEELALAEPDGADLPLEELALAELGDEETDGLEPQGAKKPQASAAFVKAVVLLIFQDLWKFLREKPLDAAQGLLGRIPKERRGLFALLCAAGLALITIIIINFANASDNNMGRGEFVQMPLAPIEDFFLPEEPDFVPGILLQRPQREVWTHEEARAFWQDDVLRYGEEIWRGRIEAMMDEILEYVP